jgi:type IV pilus assembly protein PilM
MSALTSLQDASSPPVAVEIAANRITAAHVERRGSKAVVSAHATRALPPGALVPSLTGVNAHDRATVAEGLQDVLDRVGHPRRVGLVVPDAISRVSLVRFEKVPARTPDLDQLVRWQVRKTAPFPIEEAQVSYVPGIREEGAQEFIVSLARREVVLEYESLVAEAGAHAGIVDLSTFNTVNAVLAGASPEVPGSADWIVVNVAPDYTSIAILRGRQLIFFRNRLADADGTLADLVHQTAMYYEDRLKGAGFARVILAGVHSLDPSRIPDFAALGDNIEERLGVPVETVDPRTAASLGDRVAAAPELLDGLTPLVGLLLRDREAA